MLGDTKSARDILRDFILKLAGDNRKVIDTLKKVDRSIFGGRAAGTGETSPPVHDAPLPAALPEEAPADIVDSGAPGPGEMFQLNPELPLPEGVSEEELFGFLNDVALVGAPVKEMQDYCRESFRRILYTYGLVKGLKGRCLELGAGPYFMTMMLRQFSGLDMTLANYFSAGVQPSFGAQELNYKTFRTGEPAYLKMEYRHFNIEEGQFPYKDAEFDVVMMCEIIEHLLMDPVKVLRELKRTLKPGGALILTTPNVGRLDNIRRMIAGENIYDPYSGYGPYGRHNREYNRRELQLLLDYVGFDIDISFSADVHDNSINNLPYYMLGLIPFLSGRNADLGSYIFIRAINNREARVKKPAFLYMSYPSDQLEEY